jgi:hypothetical protein
MLLRGNRAVFGLAGFALGLISLTLAVLAPRALAGPPPCQTKNVRTGVEYKGTSALATAISAAASGDTVSVWGTCVGNFVVAKQLTLQGKGNSATVDGNQSGRVLDITAGTATIRDLVITNGRTGSAGGGIRIHSNGAAVLVDTVVRGNTAGSTNFGGGIEIVGGSLRLVRSAVTGNNAGSSGGIDMDSSTVSMVRSSVTGNAATRAPSTASDGCAFADVVYACAGGIWNFHGTLSLTDSTVASNTSAYRGGGLRTDSRVAGGNATDGITLLAGSTTIASNAAGDQGGGIWARARQAGVSVDPSVGFRVANGGASYTDPLTGSTLPAWTGSLFGNTPDQCFPALTLGPHTCGPTFN